VLGVVVPWPITVGGAFTAAAPLELDLKAPEGAVVVQARAAEGTRVAAGAPVLVFRDPDLERRAIGVRRLADSLAALEGAARAVGRTDEARRLEAERAEQEARAAGLEVRRQALTLRSPVTAVVLTPRLQELVGRRFPSGAVAVRLGTPDSVELRVVLERAGATLVRPGQPVAVIAYADVSHTLQGRVASVATAAAGVAHAGRPAARARQPAGADRDQHHGLGGPHAGGRPGHGAAPPGRGLSRHRRSGPHRPRCAARQPGRALPWQRQGRASDPGDG